MSDEIYGAESVRLDTALVRIKDLEAERDRLKKQLELMYTAHSEKCFSELSRLKAEVERIEYWKESRFIADDQAAAWKAKYEDEFENHTLDLASRATEIGMLKSRAEKIATEFGCGLDRHDRKEAVEFIAAQIREAEEEAVENDYGPSRIEFFEKGRASMREEIDTILREDYWHTTGAGKMEYNRMLDKLIERIRALGREKT